METSTVTIIMIKIGINTVAFGTVTNMERENMIILILVFTMGMDIVAAVTRMTLDLLMDIIRIHMITLLLLFLHTTVLITDLTHIRTRMTIHTHHLLLPCPIIMDRILILMMDLPITIMDHILIHTMATTTTTLILPWRMIYLMLMS